jgi:hypothetical protein
MGSYNRLLCLISCVLATILTGCGGGSNGVRITEGEQTHDTETTVIASNAGVIVHIDLLERIATIRNGQSQGHNFLIASDFDGVETAALKIRSSKFSKHLLTADILEGNPKINNSVRPASANRIQELAKMYP